MKKTLYRAFALLLTASFLFTMASPAFATSVAEDTFLVYSMPADIVTSSLINGIGVLPGDDVQVYEGVVQRCVNYLTDLGRVVDGKIDVWKREQVGDNAWKYGADISLVEVVRSWVFDSSTVTCTSTVPDSESLSNYDSLVSNLNLHSNKNYVLVVYGISGDWCLYYSSYAWTWGLNEEGTNYQLASSVGGRRIYYINSTGRSGDINGTSWPVDMVSGYSECGALNNYGDSMACVSDYDISLGFIAPGSVVFGDAYPDWYRNIATIPLPGAISPDDDIKALPFAPGQTLGDTLTIPQEDVWTGSGSYVDAPAVPGTATLSDVLTAVLSIPANIVEGIGNLFFPAVDGLTMSLSDFFPFCIPYDLFEFFTLLRAEPEAPKFEWEIPVPQLGRTFEVEVDLSAWDEVAQLFRNLELLAFIVGLAFVTREKFLRS